MLRKPSHFFILFACIYTLSTLAGPFAFDWLLKIIPLLILIAVSVTFIQSTRDKLFIAGLAWSTLGDFLLAYNIIDGFVFGLAAFLIAHLCYIACLTPRVNVITKQKIAFMTMYSVYGLLMFSLIAPGLDELFIPVLIYMSVLLLMAMTTVLSAKSNLWLMLGGFSFVVSDSLIGINKFYMSLPYADLMIMTSWTKPLSRRKNISCLN
jgi:alkenylglycerophosphocholine/alkenylglycerophosphoethanolamine hydrolase